MTIDEPVSDTIDFDDIPDEAKQIINASLRTDLLLEDEYSDTPIPVIMGETMVSLDDEPEEDSIIGLESLTVADDEPEEEQEMFEYTEADLSNARVFLKRNKNVIKSSLKKLEANTTNICLLLACLEVEAKDKNREDLIKVIKTHLERLTK